MTGERVFPGSAWGLFLLPALLSFPDLLLAAEEGRIAGQQTISLTMAIFKTLGAMVLVIGLMLLVLRWVKQMGFAREGFGQTGLIRVLDLRMLAPKKHVAVLEVAGEYLAVGITDQQISLLTALPKTERLRELSNSQAKPLVLPDSFAAILNSAIRKFSAPPAKEEDTPHAH